jgi:hypothetical protein
VSKRASEREREREKGEEKSGKQWIAGEQCQRKAEHFGTNFDMPAGYSTL